MKLLECVPNFSEGRDSSKVDTIVQALLAGLGLLGFAVFGLLGNLGNFGILTGLFLLALAIVFGRKWLKSRK